MMFQNLPLLLLLLSAFKTFQVQSTSYYIPSKYTRCYSSPCMMWDGTQLPLSSCPSGTLTYTDSCKQSPTTCPGIWPELTYTFERLPVCKNTKTGCWELLTLDGNWECVDPRINACPQNDIGVLLKLIDNNWVCQNSMCPEDFLLQQPPYEPPFYKCVKRETDSFCPGDGQYEKENLSYTCVSPTCDLIKTGKSYFCPANPQTCYDTSLLPDTKKYGWKTDWYCKNPIDDTTLPTVAVLVVLVLLLGCAIQRYRARKVQKAVQNPNNSDSDYQVAI